MASLQRHHSSSLSATQGWKASEAPGHRACWHRETACTTSCHRGEGTPGQPGGPKARTTTGNKKICVPCTHEVQSSDPLETRGLSISTMATWGRSSLCMFKKTQTSPERFTEAPQFVTDSSPIYLSAPRSSNAPAIELLLVSLTVLSDQGARQTIKTKRN